MTRNPVRRERLTLL